MRNDRGRIVGDQICIFLVGCIVVLFLHNNMSSKRHTRDIPLSANKTQLCTDENFLQKHSARLEKLVVAKLVKNKLAIKPPKPYRHIRVLCFVKTHPLNHYTKCQAIKETWGKRCDKLLFFSSANEPSLPAINVLPPFTNDSRNQLTQKVFAGLRYIFARYINEYDWFHEADDDTYIILDNLRHFLSNKDPKKAVYFGHRFMKYAKQGFTSGGAAYVMSREALRRIIIRGKHEPECNRKGTASDAHVGRCLENVGAVLGSTVDSMGRSRYHTFGIDYHIVGSFPLWYINFTATAQGGYVVSDTDLTRSNYMADYPITFHYVDYRRMYTVDMLLHHTKIRGETTPDVIYE